MFNENNQDLDRAGLLSEFKDCEKRIKRLKADLEEAENNFKRINDLYTESVTDGMTKAKKKN